jgi:hypothetical protein
LNIRRIALRGLVAAPFVVAAGAAAAWQLPKLVRQKVAQQTHARFGLDAEVGEVDLGLSSIRLRGLSIGGEAGPRVSASSVEVSANPIAAAFRGTRAIDGITARDLQVDLPLHVDATRRLIDRVMGRGGHAGQRDAPPSGRSDGAGRLLRVEGFTVRVSDADGMLIALEGDHAERGPRGASAKLHRVRVGTGPQGRFRVDDLELALDAGDAGMQLRTLRAGALSVVLGRAAPTPATAETDPSSAAETGATGAEGAGTGPEGEADEETSAAPEPQRDEAPSGDQPPGRGRTLARLKRAYRMLAPGAGSPPKSGAAAAAGEGGAGEARGPVLRRLAVGAELSLADGEVRAEDESPPMLSGLSAGRRSCAQTVTWS